MSTLIADLVNDAALAIGDPNKQRVETDHWHSIYNRSNRELGQKAPTFRFIDDFDLIGGQQVYDYPQGMVQMVGLEVSATPNDLTSFRWLKEIFEDEFRDRVDAMYPVDTLPTEYFSTAGWYHLIGAAQNTIVDGGAITYFGIPDRITLDQFVAPGAVIQCEDFAQDYLLRRMIIHGMEARNRWKEAKELLVNWNEDVIELQDKLADRSDDRRSSFAPRRNPFAGMR